MPGDTIEIRDDVAWINGSEEPHYGAVVVPSMGVYLPSQTIPAGKVFVMGDNRAVSLDSRDLGPFPISDIQGRVAAVFAPITRVRRVN